MIVYLLSPFAYNADKIELVKETRMQIISNSKRSNEGGDGGFDLVAQMEAEAAARSEAMMQAEIARMEGLRRRQEKEIEKMVEKEQQVAEVQRKTKKAEEDAIKKEKERLKAVAKQKELAAKKQVKFLQDKAEKERETERKRKEIMKKEEEVKKKLEAEKEKEMKRIAKEAARIEAETAAKLEAKRLKSEAILKELADQAERNRLEMLAKEQKVKEQMAQKKAELARAIQAKKDAAAARIAASIEKFHQIHEQKKLDFDAREEAAQKRYKEKEIENRQKLVKQTQAREKKNNTRIQRLVDAYQTRSKHRNDIVSRRIEKDSVYSIIQREREEQLALKKFESKLRQDDKLENIERKARVDEFNRIKTLGKIYEEDMKSAGIKAAKEALLAKQRAEQKDNLNRKHEIADAMERMKITNDFTILQKVFEKQKKDNAKKQKTKNRGQTAGSAEGEHEEDPRLNQTT